MQLCTAFAQRDFPLLGSGLFQHGSHGGAAPAHRFEPMAHAARTVGILVAKTRFVTRRLRNLHQRPIGLQFIGHHHGQAGAHALAHLRAVADHGDGAIGGDADIDLGIIDQAIGHRGPAVLLHFVGKGLGQAPTGSHHQGAGRADALEETAPAKVAQGEIAR